MPTSGIAGRILTLAGSLLAGYQRERLGGRIRPKWRICRSLNDAARVARLLPADARHARVPG
jgi:hypothetical protein